jgi:hypothetical protein
MRREATRLHELETEHQVEARQGALRASDGLLVEAVCLLE